MDQIDIKLADRVGAYNEILSYLKEHIGTPVGNDELSETLTSVSGTELSARDVTKLMRDLWSQGWVYPAGGYWYLTYPGSRVKEYNPNISPSSAHTDVQTKYENTTLATRQQSVKSWTKIIDEYYPFFKKNHPEYSKFFELLENKGHEMEEFIKDTLALVLQWNMKGELSYPGEKYEYPEIWTSVDHAMQESIWRARQLKQYQDKIYAQKDYKKAVEQTQSLLTGSNKELMDFIASFPQGTFITKARVKEFVDKLLSGKAKVLDIEQIYIRVEDEIKRQIEGNIYLYFQTEDKQTVFAKFERVLTGSAKMAGTVINTFRKSGEGVRKDINEILSGVLSSGEIFDGYNFDGAQLHDLNITGSSFAQASFIEANFQGAGLTNNNFTGAKFWKTTFTPKVFTDNVIEKAEFNDAGVKSDISIEKNTGIPVNLQFKEVTFDKAALKDVLDIPTKISYAIPLIDDEVPDAVALAKALQGILMSRPFTRSSLRFTGRTVTAEGLGTAQIGELKNWVVNPEAVPQFVRDLPDPVRWFAQKNEANELLQSGLVRAEVNKLFGLIRNNFGGVKQKTLKEQEQEKVHVQNKLEEDKKKGLEEKRQVAIDAFIQQYKDAGTVPTTALLAFISDTESAFANWVSSFGKTVSTGEANTIYHALVSTLRGYTYNPYVKAVRRFETLPYTTTMYDLAAHTNVAGKGSQFGVGLDPNAFAMTPRMVSLVNEAVATTGTHLGKSYCFARIAPVTYTIMDVGQAKPTTKKVWYISEMQSDAFQKVRQESRRFDQKYGKEAVDQFRGYIRHWSENLLNVIIAKAAEVGVDEVWMPPHLEVEAKTNSGATSDTKPGQVPNWYDYYDRPAKAFGGELKDVGDSFKLDPGSMYDRKGRKFYVIPIPKEKRAHGGLEFGSLKFSALEDYDWGKIRQDLDHHFAWIIEHNRSSFPDIEKFVTNDEVAQFAYKTFFDEYHISPAWTSDGQFMTELYRIITREMGYRMPEPPYIDWLHWMQKAWDDVRFFIGNQKKITPDLGASDKELARDWSKLWVEETVPADIKRAPWFHGLFMMCVKDIVESKGLGDIFSQEYQAPAAPDTDLILHPVDKGEGEEVVEGPPGELLPGMGEGGKEKEQDLQFHAPDRRDIENYKKEFIDRYLDELQKALSNNDVARADKIRQRLRELAIESSLKFRTLQHA